MVSRNTEQFKELIFAKLNGDAPLQALLGGAGRIKHGNPENLSEYPCVTYQVITETDETYNPDVPTAITQSRILIQCFDKGPSSKVVGRIEDRIFTLLHGENISDSNILVYTCYRQSKTEVYDPKVDSWVLQSSYDLVNVLK